jgi:transcriptional regulator with XRE-family HTH domain
MNNKLNFNIAFVDEICREWGARLKARRLAGDISQMDLAARAGVSRLTVAHLETNRNRLLR